MARRSLLNMPKLRAAPHAPHHGIPSSLANHDLKPRAVASVPDPRPGRRGTHFVGAGGGNGPGERRRKGAEPQTSFKPDDSTAQSPREGIECVS